MPDRSALLTAEIGSARLEICVADITTLASTPSSMPRTGACSAAAASTARSIAPRDRNCLPNAKRSAAARPARPRSRAAIGLPAKHVIHAVGPVWNGGGEGEDELLASCYRTALDLAAAHRLTSIAFPAISTGIYRFPPDRAARIAVGTVAAELAASPRGIARVVFCCFARQRRRPPRHGFCRTRAGLSAASPRQQ